MILMFKGIWTYLWSMFGTYLTIVATGFAEEILEEHEHCVLQWDYDPDQE